MSSLSYYPQLYVGHTGKYRWTWHVAKDKGTTAMCGVTGLEMVQAWAYQPFENAGSWCAACREVLQ